MEIPVWALVVSIIVLILTLLSMAGGVFFFMWNWRSSIIRDLERISVRNMEFTRNVESRIAVIETNLTTIKENIVSLKEEIHMLKQELTIMKTSRSE